MIGVRGQQHLPMFLTNNKRIAAALGILIGASLILILFLYRKDWIFDNKTECRLEEFDENSKVYQITELNFKHLVQSKLVQNSPPVWYILL